MYTFYKIFPGGKKKYCATFNSTLDPEYHGYINWCRENEIDWELVRTYDGKVMFESEYIPVIDKVKKKIPEYNIIDFSINVDGSACLMIKFTEHDYYQRKLTNEEMKQHPTEIANLIKREAQQFCSSIKE